MTAAALSYRHPRVRTNYAAPPPRVLSVTIARYRQDFESRSGPLWDWFRSRVPALYQDDGRPGDRRRGLRTDGADSLLCVIVALLQSMDIRRGFLGRPPIEGEDVWHRRSVLELFGFAFGKPVPGALSPRRLERCLRALRELGVLITHQVRSKTPTGFESQAAIRLVTDRLFQLAGTAGQLAKERREAHQRAEQQRSAAAAARRIETVRMDRPAGGPAQSGLADRQPATADCRPRAGPPRHVGDLLRAVIPAKHRS